jgi:hypothetical protein
MDDFSNASGLPDFDAAKAALERELSIEDFWSYMPDRKILFSPLGVLWPIEAVNARIPPVTVMVTNDDGELEEKKIAPSEWLDRNKPLDQMTWMPGEPELIEGRLVRESGWIDLPGTFCYNLYRPPTIVPGDASRAGPWLRHVEFVYPDDHEPLLDWFAQRAQRPGEKINHALVLGGLPGIGKDTILYAVRATVGAHNFGDVSPKQIIGRFNPHLKNVILRVDEARDLGDYNRYVLYETMKAIIAAPPEVLRIDEKNIREYVVPNVVGVIYTTNHECDGIHLTAEDRRHYVAWSPRKPEDFPDGYWEALWHWYEKENGAAHVAAYLRERDISRFNPKKPPVKTEAFWRIVDASAEVELGWIADGIDAIARMAAKEKLVAAAKAAAKAKGKGKTDIEAEEEAEAKLEAEERAGRFPPPVDALTPDQIGSGAGFTSELYEWLKDKKNRRRIPTHLSACGYTLVRNPDDDGRWKIRGKRHSIYARKELSAEARLQAARDLVQRRSAKKDDAR